DGAEVAARGDVRRLEVEVDAQRLEHAAPDGVAHRVVAEERQVPGPAARRHAGGDGHRHAADALLRQPVQARDVRLLQLRAPALVRQTSQAVDDEEQDLRVAGEAQLAEQVEVHEADSSIRFATAVAGCGYGGSARGRRARSRLDSLARGRPDGQKAGSWRLERDRASSLQLPASTGTRSQTACSRRLRYADGMEQVARYMVLAGVVLAVAGLALWAGARLGLGRLPGDIVIDRGNVKFAFPIVTSIILSIVLTVVLNVVVRTWR